MQHAAGANAKCAVCGDKVTGSPIPGRDPTACHSPECVAVMARASRLPPETARRYLRQQSKIITRNRAERVERETRGVKQRKAEAEERERISQQVRQAAGVDSTGLVTLPSGCTDLVASDPGRVEEYTDHLRATIAAAFAQPADVPPPEDSQSARLAHVEDLFEHEPALRVISDMLCGMCRGSCCMAGKNTGYVAVSTIRRVMATNPDATEEEILATYLGYLPDQSIADACINQGPTGCTLPREIRSDTCNGYYCDDIREWHETPSDSRPMSLTVIQREKPHFVSKCSGGLNSVVQVAFVTEEGVDPDILGGIE